jgi:hypothetical protein
MAWLGSGGAPGANLRFPSWRKIACTRGFPGSVALANRTAASRACWGLAPTIHRRNTSATSRARPAGLVTGRAHSFGKPLRQITADEPV